MSRNISPVALAAYRSPRVQRAWLAHLAYDGDPVFANNRTFPIPFDWDGSGSETVFEGVGDFGGISVLKELTERRVQRMSLTLSGINPELLEGRLEDDYIGIRGHIWEAILDDDWALIEAVPVFAGEIAQQSVRAGLTATITVTLASIEEDYETVRASSYNSRDQKRIPGREGDKGLDYVEEFANGRKIKWGKS